MEKSLIKAKVWHFGKWAESLSGGELDEKIGTILIFVF